VTYALFYGSKTINKQIQGSFINTSGEYRIFIAKSNAYHMMENFGYILAVN